MEIIKSDLLKLAKNSQQIDIIQSCYDLKKDNVINACDFYLYLDLLKKKGLISFWVWLQNAMKIIIDKQIINI